MKAIFALSSNRSLPILDCVMYQGQAFHATDLETHVTVPFKIDGLPDGTLINRKWLSLIFAQSTNGIHYSSDGKLNGIAIPDTGMTAQDFPFNTTIRNKFDRKATLSIAGADLRGVKLASAKGDMRYYLNGALVDYDKARIAATDGHRLHVQTGMNVTGTGAAIIPTGTLDVALKAAGKDSVIWIDFDPDVDGAWIRLTVGATAIYCRPIDGKFPDIDKVIPKYGATSATIKIDGKQGVKDIKRYSQLAKSTGDFKFGGCCFKHRELNGSLSLPVESVSMKGIEAVGVNAAYMIDALTFLDEQQSTFRGIDHNSSLEARSGNRTAVVMPMRL